MGYITFVVSAQMYTAVTVRMSVIKGARIESFIAYSTCPDSLTTTVEAQACLFSFDLQTGVFRPVPAESVSGGPAYFHLEIMDPKSGVPVSSSERVLYSGSHVTLQLTTHKGGHYPIRTVLMNQDGTARTSVVQTLQIPTRVGRF